MAAVNNTTRDTVNAAASVIFSSESHRTQPPPAQPKKRWGGCWSSYWCFGSNKSSKRIGHAVHVPETGAPAGPAAAAAAVPNTSTAVVMPFIVPPSSPASRLQSDPPSDPPSATQSPAGPISLTSLSLNAYSSGGPASMFTIGPYAYDTQLVSPPVFSNFTTEPSTASFTPPPESVHQTTPSSPEVPYAQLLTSYRHYPGSPGALISPGSVISTSGSSTPFPDRHPILEFHKGDAPKYLSSEQFATRRWSSRVGSGSLTPDGAGQGSRLGSGQVSRLGSGSLTPDGAGQGSRLGSGSVTPTGIQLTPQIGSGCLVPDGMGPNSWLGSGFFMPDDSGPIIRDDLPGVIPHANSGHGCQTNAALVDHRVSFEFTGEDVARCLANKSGSLLRNMSQSSQSRLVEDPVNRQSIQKDYNNCDLCSGKPSDNKPDKAPGEGEVRRCQKHISLDSSKEFNFDNRKGDVSDNAAGSSEWWSNKKVAGKEGRSSNSWAFFPMLQPENN